MKLSEITESFDSKVPYTVVRASNDSFITKAYIGNRTIMFTANMIETGLDIEPIYSWEIEFLEKSTNWDYTYSKTGSGSELQVFSFIIDSIKELIERYRPDEIQFASENTDENRSSVYSRLANKIKIPGYHLNSINKNSRSSKFSIMSDRLMAN